MIQPKRKPGVGFSILSKILSPEMQICKTCARAFLSVQGREFCSVACRLGEPAGPIPKRCKTAVLPSTVSSDGFTIQRVAIAYDRAGRIIRLHDRMSDDPEKEDSSTIEFERIFDKWQTARRWLVATVRKEFEDGIC